MITTELVEEFKKEYGDMALGLRIDWNHNGSTYTMYYTNYDIPLVKDDEVYNPFDFTVESIDYSSDSIISDLTINLNSVAPDIRNIILNQDQRGVSSELYTFFIKDGKITLSLTMFSGKISEIGLNSKKIAIRLKNELIAWTTNTFRIHTLDMFPNQSDVAYSQIYNWGAK